MRCSHPSLRRLLSALALAALTPLAASAEITFYMSESEWQAAWQASAGEGAGTISFDTTAENLEPLTGYTPGPDTSYSESLFFPQDVTGLCRSFELRALEPGAEIVFDDDGPTGSDQRFDAALWIGEIEYYAQDDFDLAFYANEEAPMFAFGFHFATTASLSTRTMTVYDTQASATFSSFPDASSADAFVGMISDYPIAYLVVDEEGSEIDDIAIKDFRFDDPTSVDTDGDGLRQLRRDERARHRRDERGHGRRRTLRRRRGEPARHRSARRRQR